VSIEKEINIQEMASDLNLDSEFNPAHVDFTLVIDG
jgi:hypothetical protein